MNKLILNQGGRVVNPPDLRLLSVKGDTKSETQGPLVRETSGLRRDTRRFDSCPWYIKFELEGV